MVFPKRRIKTTSTQCTRERKPTARGGGDTIHTDAITEVPAAAAAAATGIITAAAITARAGGLYFQISLYCNYIGPHILWQDTFLQSSFAALSDDDMASSRENLVALQTLGTVK